MAVHEASDVNYVIRSAEGGQSSAADAVDVDIETIDSFSRARGIEEIDYLKIDTEGYDLEVLRGTEQMLNSRRVGFVQVEAGMNPLNRKHVPLAEFVAYLEPKGYLPFGVYEQHLEWSGEPRLRLCNAVFVSEEAVRARR